MKGKYNKKGRLLKPETLALGLGYDAFLSEGSIKPPIFMTSTFKFQTAQEGKHFFDIAYGHTEKLPDEAMGLIYSRVNNPNMEIYEERVAVMDGGEKAAVFASGMAAISTTLLTFLGQGDHMIATMPVYGGTYFFMANFLKKYGIHFHSVPSGADAVELLEKKIAEIGVDKVKLVYAETPANPSIAMTDIEKLVKLVADSNKNLAKDDKPMVSVVDNTFLGPVFQKPSLLGADLVIYSATKFLGGHSDLVAGVVVGKENFMKEVIVSRTIFGSQASPHTGWMLLRSLETLTIRMEAQAKSAEILANVLNEHPKVNFVTYPTLFKKGSKEEEIFKKQCTGAGSLISFEVPGGMDAAFKVLNAFELMGLAVSLGGTESLVEHPMTMTHSDVPPEELRAIGVTEGLIRISVGVENVEDLKHDILNALEELD